MFEANYCWCVETHVPCKCLTI